MQTSLWLPTVVIAGFERKPQPWRDDEWFERTYGFDVSTPLNTD